MDYNSAILHPKDEFVPQKKSPFIRLSKKNLLIFGGVVLFFILYSGGTYYILFAQEEKKGQVNPLNYKTTTFPTIVTPMPTQLEMPTPSSEVISSPSPTEIPPFIGTKKYTNETYDMTVSFPATLTISFNAKTANPDPYFMKLSYVDTTKKGTLSVDVQDIQYIGQSDLESRRIVQLNLLDFATSKWTQNSTYTDPNILIRKISSLTLGTFLGEPAYFFTLTGSWNDDRTYKVLPEEYTYIVTQHDGFKMIISYPTNDALLKQTAEGIVFF